ncbi:MAG: DUF3857 domain-containing protein [Candidatus Zixiibacteriota bacterium]|nr:MAG: DUF3857 domain-containing protein [candidate division Zixibacteria bacterium]
MRPFLLLLILMIFYSNVFAGESRYSLQSITIKFDGEKKETAYHKILKIEDDIDPNEFRYFKLNLPNFYEIDKFQIQVTDQKGKKRKYKDKDCLIWTPQEKVVLTTDYRLVTWDLGYLDSGYVVEYAYCIKTEDAPALAADFLPLIEEVAVDSSVVEFHFPDDKWKLKYSIDNAAPEYLYRKKEAKFRWGSQAKLKDSVFEKAPEDCYPGIWYIFESTVGETDFAKWDDVNEWCSANFESAEAFNDEFEMLDIANSIRDIKERISEKCRYTAVELGEGYYKPFPAQEVWDKGYGDCKGLTNLFVSWAGIAGYNSWPVLVYIGKGRQGNPDFPSPFQFNHVIAGYEDESGDTAYQDITANFFPLGMLPIELYGCFAFPLIEGSEPIRLQYVTDHPDTVRYRFSGQMDSDNSFKGFLEGHYTGQRALMLEWGESYTRRVDLQKVLGSMLEKEIPKVYLNNLEILYAGGNSLDFRADLIIPGFCYKRGPETRIKTWIFDYFKKSDYENSPSCHLLTVRRFEFYDIQYKIDVSYREFHEITGDSTSYFSENLEFSSESGLADDSLTQCIKLLIKPRIIDFNERNQYFSDMKLLKDAVIKGIALR